MNRKNLNDVQILFVGNGRLAKHLRAYFQLLQTARIDSTDPNSHHLVIDGWQRQHPSPDLSPQDQAELQSRISSADIIYICIKDSDIESFWQKHLQPYTNPHQIVVHFSGSLHIAGLPCAHPLMTFGDAFYDLATYQRMPFVLTLDSSQSDTEIFFQKAFPGLKNSFKLLAPEDKPLYHAMCVMGGNFPILLWQKMRSEFLKLNLNENEYAPYLEQVLKNFLRDPEGSLTGPLVRQDRKTIEANLAALNKNSYKPIYEAFVAAYNNEQRSK